MFFDETETEEGVTFTDCRNNEVSENSAESFEFLKRIIRLRTIDHEVKYYDIPAVSRKTCPELALDE